MEKTDSIWAKVQLNSPPEKFYGFFRNNMGDLVHMFPEKFKGFHFVEGDEFCNGSVMHWRYHLGSPAAAKIKLKGVDDARKSITYEILEGDILNHYKVFRAKIEAIHGGIGKGGSYAKWSIEFEKANEHVGSPDDYLDLAVKVSKGLDSYLSKN